MTKKKTATKNVAVKKSRNLLSCPVLQKILSYRPEELNETSRLKREKKKAKKERSRLRKAEDQRKEEEKRKYSSSHNNATATEEVTTFKKKKQLPPPPKLSVQVLTYLHKPHSYDRDKVPENLKQSFRYTGQVINICIYVCFYVRVRLCSVFYFH